MLPPRPPPNRQSKGSNGEWRKRQDDNSEGGPNLNIKVGQAALSKAIADNLSAHKTKRVAQFLAEHPKVYLHFTPTYSSWLNKVELWFGRIEREVVARGVFTSLLGRTTATNGHWAFWSKRPISEKIDHVPRHYNVTFDPTR